MRATEQKNGREFVFREEAAEGGEDVAGRRDESVGRGVAPRRPAERGDGPTVEETEGGQEPGGEETARVCGIRIARTAPTRRVIAHSLFFAAGLRALDLSTIFD